MRKTGTMILCGFVIGFLCCCILMIYVLSHPKLYAPTEGIWYCEELQMQLAPDKLYGTYTVIHGRKIRCWMGNDRGSRWISVGVSEGTIPEIAIYSEIFTAECVELNDREYTVREKHTGNIYVFDKIE